ncbi:hypothetical protein S40293_04491 [Stachybotrys chartarum IBT 40293]|nr:hypothetical protein S40293_04491 [Stachybotrys chartarum IBT 40293]
MVNTRSQTADASPASASKPRASNRQVSKPSPASSSSSSSSSTTTTTTAAAASGWRHVPTRWTVIWMAVSLPLVVWDTVYVLGRPLTMEGGPLHWPLWAPYKLYGEVDHIYGWKAFNAHNGFTAAQGTLNVIETVMYAAYLWLARSNGRTVGGRQGALAVLIGFSAAVMTLSKTVLYWLNEYFSGFDNIGHNAPLDLLFLWIIPNGAWLVGSAYMIWSMGGEIIDGLTLASRSKAE